VPFAATIAAAAVFSAAPAPAPTDGQQALGAPNGEGARSPTGTSAT